MSAESRPTSWIASLLREHPALLLTAVYVVASAIGMFYSWSYLRHFGINVFNYAQIGDFLLASLKEPFTWALVLLAVFLVSMDNAASRRAEQKVSSRWFRWYGSPRYRSINFLVAVLMILAFLFGYAQMKARQTFEGYGQVVQVTLADQSDARSAILLGTTSQFLFLFDASTRDVDIHPFESVESISYYAPDPP